MMILEASVEIPWLSRDLQTSGTSAAPFLDTEGESFLGCLEETAVSFCWVEVPYLPVYNAHFFSPK